MAKAANPVRGYVPCPVCHTIATAHQVGEGKLIEQGEPPKNLRNLGLHYYKCPECGNSSISKKVSTYVEEHMKPTRAEFEGELITVEETEPLNEVTEPVTEPLTVTQESAETSTDVVSNGNETEHEEEKKPPFFTPKRIMMGLIMVMVLGWIWTKLKPKAAPLPPKQAEVSQ